MAGPFLNDNRTQRPEVEQNKEEKTARNASAAEASKANKKPN